MDTEAWIAAGWDPADALVLVSYQCRNELAIHACVQHIHCMEVLHLSYLEHIHMHGGRNCSGGSECP